MAKFHRFREEGVSGSRVWDGMDVIFRCGIERWSGVFEASGDEVVEKFGFAVGMEWSASFSELKA